MRAQPSSRLVVRPEAARPGAGRSRSRGTRLLVALLLAGAVPPAAARAATFCVGTPTELRDALLTAQANGADDVIRVRKGTYATPAGGYSYDAQERNDLTIVGGYILFIGGSCAKVDSTPFNPILDGGGDDRVLQIYVHPPAGTGAPTLHLENLTLTNGDLSGGQPGAGLQLEVTSNVVGATVELVGNAVLHNHCQNSGGGVDLRLGAFATVRVLGNLFVDNHSLQGGTALDLTTGESVDAAINNNTFTLNYGPDATAYFLCDDQGLVTVSNNILWANTADYDLGLWGTADYGLIANDWQHPLSGMPPVLDTANLMVDPKFVAPASNWDLLPNSPVTGHGADPPLGGVPAKDILGRPRIAGTLDLGAYETQDLFCDGFETGAGVWSAKKG
jgi:hypothetical protein